jgi:hypothetical protein
VVDVTIEQDFETVQNRLNAYITDHGVGHEALSRIKTEIERLRAESAYNYAEAEKVPRLVDENDRLQAAGTAFVSAFNQRFKPVGIEEEFDALCQALEEK